MCLKVRAPPSLHYKCAACSEVIISRKIERLKNRFKTKKINNEWVVARNRLVHEKIVAGANLFCIKAGLTF